MPVWKERANYLFYLRKKKKSGEIILPIMVTFLQLINVPTFIRIILIVFHFCLKLV